MSTLNLQSYQQPLKPKADKLPYRKPEVHPLGSLEQVQGSEGGPYREYNGYYY